MKSLKELYEMNNQDLDRYIFTYYSGNTNKKARQELMQILTGEKIPVAKCGVHALIEKIIEKKKELQND